MNRLMYRVLLNRSRAQAVYLYVVRPAQTYDQSEANLQLDNL